jgi:hypothetical protein
MSLRFASIGLAALVLAGCQTTAAQAPAPSAASSDPIEKGSPVSLTAAQNAAVKAGVRKSLKDPDSARFDDGFKAVKDSKGVVSVCGMVNAKNSYGGYTGSKPFVGVLVSSGGFIVAGMGGTEGATYGVQETCKQMGIVI